MRLGSEFTQFGNIPFAHASLRSVLAGYKRPNDKIGRLMAQGDLIALKKGLYVLSDRHRDKPLSLPLIANLLYGPSYASLDFALSWHGLIPDGVVEVTSVTIGRARLFDTPVGRFSYVQCPMEIYGIGLRLLEDPGGTCSVMASPEKALCDKLLYTRKLQLSSVRSMRVFLEEDLRIDWGELCNLDVKVIRHCLNAIPNSRRLALLLKVLEAEHA